MADHAANPSADYDIRVAEDQLAATVRIEPGGLIDPDHLIQQLTRAGIHFIDHATITAAAEALRQAAKPREENAADVAGAADRPKAEGVTLVVARGQPMVEDEPEKLTKIDPAPPADPPASHYERIRLVTVQPKEAIASITPMVKGHDGVDVFGRPIPRKRPASPITPGEGAIRDGHLMLAERAGRVKIEGSRIGIEPRLDIPGDISFATGNVRFDGDINIHGSVLDLFLVQSTADIHVGGTVEAAQLLARGSLTIGGGIAGKDKGHCTAGGNLSCRYISNARVQAGDGLTVHGEVANSRVIAGGRLFVEAGPIFASQVTANGGVECRSLGNAASAKTLAEVGSHPDLKRLAVELLPQLHRCLHEVQHMKDIVQPLLRDPKRLNEQQREQATKLLYYVAKTDGDLAAKLEAFRAAFRFSQERFKPEIIVHDTLYPDVTIRLPGLEATVTTEFTGPLKIAESKGSRRKSISLINLETDSVFTLITRPTASDECADLREILEIAA